MSVWEARRWDRGGCAWAWDWPGSMRSWQGEEEKDEGRSSPASVDGARAQLGSYRELFDVLQA